MFGDEQIREVLSRQTDATTMEIIIDNPDLVDMARRPVLIEFILEALPEMQEGKPADMAHIYYYAARRKMERDIKAERTFTSLADKLYFLCELSWEMFSTDRMNLNYKLFPEHIRRYFGPKVAEVEEDHWHYDLLGQTMLVRDADGNYTPAHRSLLEFFVAYKLVAEMGALREEFIEAARRQSDILTDIPAQDYTWSAYFHRERGEAGELCPMPLLRSFTCEPMKRLATIVGLQPLTPAVLTLMDGMVTRNSLLRVLEATRGLSVQEVSYTGGNVATILNRQRFRFQSLNLTRSVLVGADLRYADLYKANLRGANIVSSGLVGANMAFADFREANFTGSLIAVAAPQVISWSPDGRNLIGCGNSDALLIWKSDSWEVKEVPQAHEGVVDLVSWSHNAK